MKTAHVFFCSLLVCSTPSFADTPEQIIQEMQDAGFVQISRKTTLLGRTVIEGFGPGGEREVVLSRSGRVLRDEFELEDEDGDALHDDFEDWREERDDEDEDDDDAAPQEEDEYASDEEDGDEEDDDQDDSDEDDADDDEDDGGEDDEDEEDE
ncbi:MAG: hypothetical protein AAF429_07220 [Pseudomonadota bacterium]